MSLDFKKLWKSTKFQTMDLPDEAKNFINGYISDEEDGKTHKINYTLYPCIQDGNPESKPTIFWTMGGPGISQLFFWRGMGGPLRAGSKGLKFNKHSWIKFANVVTMDYPWGNAWSRNGFKPHISTEKEWQYKMPHRFNRFVKRF